jgi:pimeloyl-ACP methyl ester carboxylesterase
MVHVRWTMVVHVRWTMTVHVRWTMMVHVRWTMTVLSRPCTGPTTQVGKLARLTLDGTSIHFEVHGQGQPLLMTHGFGATCRMWDEQIEEFTDRHRLIVWDLPGHGNSDNPRNTTTNDNVVEDMLALLDTENAKRAVLVGLGAGGSLSLRFWRAYPQRVRGLVLIGTMPGLRSGPARGMANAQVKQLAEALEREGVDALEGGAETDPRVHIGASGLAIAARILLNHQNGGALPWLADIGVPVLILVGSEDRPNLSAAEHMARIIPNARKIVIARANHAANIHKPDAVNAAIRDFLGRLPA